MRISTKGKSNTGETVQEMMEIMGLSRPAIKRILYELKAQGTLRVGRRKIVDLCGRNTTVPVYWKEEK